MTQRYNGYSEVKVFHLLSWIDFYKIAIEVQTKERCSTCSLNKVPRIVDHVKAAFLLQVTLSQMLKGIDLTKLIKHLEMYSSLQHVTIRQEQEKEVENSVCFPSK